MQNISIDRSVPNQLTIQDVTVPMKTNSKHPEMIPNPLFFEIPSHTLALRDMLRDLASGERHLLLLGPQGCGKNKLADYLLHLLQVNISKRRSANGSTVVDIFIFSLFYISPNYICSMRFAIFNLFF